MNERVDCPCPRCGSTNTIILRFRKNPTNSSTTAQCVDCNFVYAWRVVNE